MTPPPGNRQPPPGPYSVLLTGGRAEDLAPQIAALRAQTMRPAQAWIIQPNHDPAVTALQTETSRPIVRVIRQDQAPVRWAPLIFTWFMPDAYTLLLAPGARPAPHFAEAALNTMRRRRAMVCAAGRQADGPVGPSGEDQVIEAGEGAWFFETHWIRHAWARPPRDLDGDPIRALTAALRAVGTPLALPALPDGTTTHLLG